MDALYVFLIRNDVWIYILCGLGLFWYITQLLQAQSALRRAMFNLERETSLRTRNSALFFVLLFGTIVGAVFYVNQAVAPTLPAEMLRPATPTPNPFALPGSTAGQGQQQGTTPNVTPTSPVMAPTVTLPGDAGANPPAGQITTTLPVTATTRVPASPPPLSDSLPTVTPNIAGCAPNATITDPRDGSTIFGALSIFGSATLPDFGYYEVEINGPQTNGQWATPLGRRVERAIDDGFLGSFDLSQWQSGTYQLRLTVANTAEKIIHQCVIEIALEN